MQDRLEKFIKDRREEFDDETPNLKVWAALDKELSKETKGSKLKPVYAIRRWVSAAAAAILLIGMGALLGIQISKSQYSPKDSLSGILNEFSEMEDFYKIEIAKKVALIDKTTYEQSVKVDLQQLDEFLSDLKNELEEETDEGKEDIINAMIINYKTRLDILERILEKINSSNQKGQENEKANIEI